MKYQIIDNIIPGLPKKAYRYGVSAYEGVVAHATASTASDERQVEYFTREWKNRQAFVHFFVDWDSIRQTADLDYKAWGAGNGNPRYVHVELCETDDPAKFEESYKRYVWLLSYILKRKNLGVTEGKTLVSHDWVSKNLGGTNHTDPIEYLKKWGKTFSDLVADVKAEYEGCQKPAPTPVKQIVPEPAKPTPVPAKKYPLPTGVYNYGDKGPAITKLQVALNAAFFKCGTPDGIYGPKTEDAVTRFQKVYMAYDVDGIYGPKTRAALDKVVNK